VRRRAIFALSLPERALRALFAALGGAVHETAQVLLPRVVRRSRFYEATAKNALRLAIELVGGVERPPGQADPAEVDPGAPAAGELLKRKAAGNVVELGSIAAFGFSPLWLLAGAADALRGSRVYLDALVGELKRAEVLKDDASFASLDDLLGALEGTSGGTARMIDVPPLELAELRRSVSELRADASGLPTPAELAQLYDGLRAAAAAEGRSLLEVSAGVGLAFLLSARSVGREHLVTPYREDWRPLRREGLAAYARRVAQPYGDAVTGHFDAGRATLTERGLDRLRKH
jgi:hypothetical protein